MRFRWMRIVAATILPLFFTTPPAQAEQVGDAANPSPDGPGVSLKFEPLSASAKPDFVDVRASRLVALYVPHGASPSPFTPAGTFRATFEGDISVRLRTNVHFSAEGCGKLTVSVGGKPVLETSGEDLSKITSEDIRLGKGKNHLVAIYDSPANGDANVRLTWSSRSWRPEPLPPTVLTHDVSNPGFALSAKIRQGRFLFARFRCQKCHAAGESTSGPGDAAMPELAMDAPSSLYNAGYHLNENWIAQGINDPHAIRHDAEMPRLVRGSQAPQQAADIAAYIVSLSLQNPATLPAYAGNAKAGGQLFANLDCIACHTSPGAKPDLARVSLDRAGWKFKFFALVGYLQDPQAGYSWNPMPNFHLSLQQAVDLATFLFEQRGKPPTGAELVGNTAMGKTLVASAGCLNCHSIENQKSALHAPELKSTTDDGLGQGCLAAKSDGPAPGFALSTEDRLALIAFLKTNRSSLRHDCAPEFAERQITALRCTACHSRDGMEAAIAQSLDAESQALHQKYPNPPVAEHDLLAADQRPPMLTWTGEKLRPDWMADFIGGQIPYKPRYYLRARMPSFPAQAKQIAIGLAEEHGCPPDAPPLPKPEAAVAEAGRQLSGKAPNQGFSCVQCHAVAGVPPVAAFEAPAIDFKYISQRLRHEYFVRWMRDPLRINPNSKMPRFDDDEGKTGLAAFDHDAAKQFAAIWEYLLAGESIQPPGE